MGMETVYKCWFALTHQCDWRLNHVQNVLCEHKIISIDRFGHNLEWCSCLTLILSPGHIAGLKWLGQMESAQLKMETEVLTGLSQLKDLIVW